MEVETSQNSGSGIIATPPTIISRRDPYRCANRPKIGMASVLARIDVARMSMYVA